MTIEVAFAGERGSFAEDAAMTAFPGTQPLPLPSFRDVAEWLVAQDRKQEADRRHGVLPIENLVGGTVREVYDLLLDHPLEITGEVIVPVRLCLAALPDQGLDAIDRVYSHGQALGQAERFLRSRGWKLLATYNTAGSGRMIAERRELGAGALLSPRGAALFGLEVLVDDVQDVPDNRTRFLVVTRRADGRPEIEPATEAAMRTTLVMAVTNEPGSLHRCLGVFAQRGVNVSKLESRPSRRRPWEYVFWLDLDGATWEAPVSGALADLDAVAASVRLIGCYPRARDA